MISPYRTIHLIDDDAINNLLNRQFLTFALPKTDILTFQDAEVLTKYLAQGKVAPPDLFLLDINMPEMDGWEFLYSLRQLNIESDVMILSSSVHWDDIDKARTYGNVKCYIPKPLTEEKIRRHIVEQDFSYIGLD